MAEAAKIISHAVWGAGEIDVSLIRFPAGVIRYRLRLRNKDFALIYLRFEDRLESWVLGQDEKGFFPMYRQGLNLKGTADAQ